MAWVGKLFSNVRGLYNEINSATLTGAIDVVVVQQEDGSYQCSPFHVRFGKLGVLRSREKVVDIEINGESMDLHMKLGEAGEAFFVQEAPSEEIPAHLATSPLPSSIELMEQGIKEMKKAAALQDDDTTQDSDNTVQVETPAAPSGDQMDELAKLIKGETQPEAHVTTSLPNIKHDNNKTSTEGNPNVETTVELDPKSKRRKRKIKKKEADEPFQTDRIRHDTGSNTSENFGDDEDIFNMDFSGDETSDMHNLKEGSLSVTRTVSLPIIQERRSEMTDHWVERQLTSEFHPFSDGDITPIMSPVATRPPSPKSDTEYEMQQKYEKDNEDSIKWEWGELPTPQPKSHEKLDKQNSKKIIGNEQPQENLVQFMRQTKKLRHKPEQEGIYLEDLNLEEMDPEVAALYIYHNKGDSRKMLTIKDEDNESGHGLSLPQSPVSVEHAPTSSKISDFGMSDISMSLCGGLKDADGNIPTEKFLQYLVTYSDFCKDPLILTNTNLVIRIDGKCYNWQTAAPIVMSVLAFQQPLPDEVVESLVKQNMPKKDRKRTWYWWGSSAADDKSSSTTDPQSSAKKEELLNPPSSIASSPPCSPQRTKTKDRINSCKDDGSLADDEMEATDKDVTKPEDEYEQQTETYQKAVRLTSDQLAKLNLKEGPNEITYSVTTSYQGTTRCNSYIYLWKYDDKVIISDIDGTITKSDVLGQVLPMFGKDWSQTGITHLYNSIANNGYRFLFLSARAIGQAKLTRDFLKSIRQGEMGLPEGPLFLSPSSLIHAFHKEVIERKPEEFKIQCLRDVKALFPSTRNPFYAGYGNKINDVWSYRAVGVPISRIFTVNHRGELRHELTQTFQTTYSRLNDVVDHIFPPLLHRNSSRGKVQAGNFHAPGEFSTFTYWRDPLPDITLEIDSLVLDKTDTEKKEQK